jgi:hypothetical protein
MQNNDIHSKTNNKKTAKKKEAKKNQTNKQTKPKQYAKQRELANITLYDNGTVILSFCCSDTYNGSSTLSDYLPKTFPFVFLKVCTTRYFYVQKM